MSTMSGASAGSGRSTLRMALPFSTFCSKDTSTSRSTWADTDQFGMRIRVDVVLGNRRIAHLRPATRNKARYGNREKNMAGRYRINHHSNMLRSQ